MENGVGLVPYGTVLVLRIFAKPWSCCSIVVIIFSRSSDSVVDVEASFVS
jgi:hypothetical protein